MINRCMLGSGSKGRYKGMEVEKDWLWSFSSFVEDLGLRPEGTSLDRIDVHLGYVRGNCRWADAKTQARNKTNTVFVQYQGDKWVLADLCENLGVCYEMVRGRLKIGMDVETALSKPKRHSWTKIEVDGHQLTLREYCESRNASYQLTRDRLRFGWELEDAVTLPKGSRKPIRDYE